MQHRITQNIFGDTEPPSSIYRKPVVSFVTGDSSAEGGVPNRKQSCLNRLNQPAPGNDDSFLDSETKHQLKDIVKPIIKLRPVHKLHNNALSKYIKQGKIW